MKQETRMVMLHHIVTIISLFLCGSVFARKRKGAGLFFFTAVQLFAAGKIALEAAGLRKQTLSSKLSHFHQSLSAKGKNNTGEKYLPWILLAISVLIKLGVPLLYWNGKEQ